MEKDMQPSAAEILNRFPNVNNIRFKGMKGKQEKVDICDLLGVDAIINLSNSRCPFTVQVKCMKSSNFASYGKTKKSFILGHPNDLNLIFNSSRHVNFCDLLLVGYTYITPEKNKVINPFCLIQYTSLLSRIQQGRIKLNLNSNSRKSTEHFVWVEHEHLAYSNVIVKDKDDMLICDFSRFTS